MSNIDTGGPAFPEAGMTIRDYFAAKAMVSFLSLPQFEQTRSEKIAKWSYEMADEMIKERNTP